MRFLFKTLPLILGAFAATPASAVELANGEFKLGMTHQQVIAAARAVKAPATEPLRVADPQFATTGYVLAGREVTLPGSEHLQVQYLSWGQTKRYTFTFAGPKGGERVTSIRREETLSGKMPTSDGLAAALAQRYGTPSIGYAPGAHVPGNAWIMWSFTAAGGGRKFTGPAPHQLCDQTKAFSGTPRGYTPEKWRGECGDVVAKAFLGQQGIEQGAPLIGSLMVDLIDIRALTEEDARLDALIRTDKNRGAKEQSTRDTEGLPKL